MRRWMLTLAVAICTVAGCDGSGDPDRREVPTRVAAPPPTAADVPTPSLDGMEPRVRAIIVDTRRQVIESLDRGDVWGKYGMVLQAHALGDDARRAYEQATALAPYDFRWAYLRAEVLREQEFEGIDLATVEDAYAAACELDPDYAPLHARLGEVRSQRGDYEGACDAYRRALELDDSQIPARCGLARALLTLGETEAALEEIRTAEAMRPDDWEVQMLLARAWGKAGERERAREAANRARGLPQQIDFRDPVGSSVLNYAVSATACFKRAQALYQEAQYEEALLNLRVVQEVRPEHAAVYERIGWCQLRLERFPAAAKSFRRALERDDTLAQAHTGLAIALTELGEIDEARRHELLAQGGADH